MNMEKFIIGRRILPPIFLHQTANKSIYALCDKSGRAFVAHLVK